MNRRAEECCKQDFTNQAEGELNDAVSPVRGIPAGWFPAPDGQHDIVGNELSLLHCGAGIGIAHSGLCHVTASIHVRERGRVDLKSRFYKDVACL